MPVITTSIPIQNLRNTEAIQFHGDILKVTNRNNPMALKIQPQYDSYFQSNLVLAGIYKKDAANPITATITTADTRRDNAITGISAVISGYIYHFDATVNIAANLLNNHLLSYGAGITRLNYQSKTFTITSILEDWEGKPELAAAITFLKQDDWKDELKAANNAFNDLYIDRTQDLGGSGDATMKAKRLESANAYYELRNKLNAYAIVLEDAEAEPYIKVINELNALIDQYNRLLAGRGGNGDAPPTPLAEPPVS